jgi:hypothetical protein
LLLPPRALNIFHSFNMKVATLLKSSCSIVSAF